MRLKKKRFNSRMRLSSGRNPARLTKQLFKMPPFSCEEGGFCIRALDEAAGAQSNPPSPRKRGPSRQLQRSLTSLDPGSRGGSPGKMAISVFPAKAGTQNRVRKPRSDLDPGSRLRASGKADKEEGAGPRQRRFRDLPARFLPAFFRCVTPKRLGVKRCCGRAPALRSFCARAACVRFRRPSH